MNTLNQEADMGYVRDFVAKVAEALVAATELPKQIKTMQDELARLDMDLGNTKSRNIELDNALNDTRRQRDEAEQALSQVKNDLSLTTQRLNSAESHANEMTRTVEDLNQALSKAKAERDDYGMKQMEAEERASQAEAKLAKLAEALGLPKPQPVPEPAKYYQDVAKEATAKVEELTKPALSQSAPQAVAEPTKVPDPKRVYEGEPGFNNLDHKTESFEAGRGWYRVNQEIPF